MKILLSKVIHKSNDRVWDSQTIDVFFVFYKSWLEPSTRRVSEDLSNYKTIKKNYFAYNPYRINVGSIWLFSWDIWAVSPAYVVFSVDEDEIIPTILLQFLKSSKWLFEINKNTHGWVRKSLSIWDLWKIEIELPDIDIQKEVLEKMNKQSIEIERINEINFTNQDLVFKLKQSILQDAIEWKLMPQDPNNEPVSELLKRIQTEKEKLIAEKKIRKPKNLTPITDEEKPFELPKGWEWLRLVEITKLITDWTHKTPLYINKWIPFISAQNLFFNHINYQKVKYISNEEYIQYFSNKNLEKFDVLLAKSWTLWTTALYLKDDKYAFYESICLIRLFKEEISPYYISYFLNCNSSFYKKNIQKGIGVKHLHLEDIRNFIIPLPPFEEQKRIVAKVDELMELCELLGKEVNEAKANGEKLMESVLGEVFR